MSDSGAVPVAPVARWSRPPDMAKCTPTKRSRRSSPGLASTSSPNQPLTANPAGFERRFPVRIAPNAHQACNWPSAVAAATDPARTA